ncbi:NEL-type E3 ubiquitin ligase domain-containing protein [Xanthomonas populi]|uniref:NEL-type E3 ubiquitin ligase domain-containing protein n=1 Tax=Xanthomonas populi TaxID=53414 RepID=UPI001304C37C|nr:NEL-type E3 ubiquitin ligase domain-containing protein [Xanthomonas populi]
MDWSEAMRALQIHVNSQLGGTDESPPRALGEQVDHWLTAACQPCLENGHAFDDEFNAGQFSKLLEKRYQATAHQSEIEQGEVLQLGAEVINAVAADPELRKLVFAMAESALGTCHDNVSTGFSAIVNTVRNHQMSLAVKQRRLNAAGLQAWASRQFRLDALESEVHRFIKRSIKACTTELEQFSGAFALQACVADIQRTILTFTENFRLLAPLDPRIGELMDRIDQSGSSDSADITRELASLVQDILARYAAGQLPAAPTDPGVQYMVGMMQYMSQRRNDWNQLASNGEVSRQYAQLASNGGLPTEEQSFRQSQLFKRLKTLQDEPVETMMHAKVMLREELDLPNVPSSMIFQSISALTNEDLTTLASSVRERERDKDAFGDFMLANETWRAGVKQLYAAEYEALMESFNNDAFYELDVPPGDDAHVAESIKYNELAADFLDRKQKAENAWLREKVGLDISG